MSLRLSKKYGLNPSVGLCFWCGEADGTILLLGSSSKKITGQEEAPHQAVYSYDPCETCQERMNAGITFIEATDDPTREGFPKIGEGYPTGRWAVVLREAVDTRMRQMFDNAVIDHILEKGKVFVDPKLYEILGLGNSSEKDGEEEQDETV